ncbi:MAG: hypothetical protein ACJASX_003219 [Limisphaerales bacterium]|jgi:hypothetical protein
MKNTNPSAGQSQTTGKKRRFLSAEKKFQIYLEAQRPVKYRSQPAARHRLSQSGALPFTMIQVRVYNCV